MQGAYNGYAAIKAYWSDTVVEDNLRGGDATGAATPGAQEISIASDGTVSGIGNTVHTYSEDVFYWNVHQRCRVCQRFSCAAIHPDGLFMILDRLNLLCVSDCHLVSSESSDKLLLQFTSCKNPQCTT